MKADTRVSASSYPPLDPQVSEVLGRLPKAPGWWLTMDVIAQRTAWAARTRQDPPGPSMPTINLSFKGSSGHSVPARVYLPDRSAESAPGIVYFHGGGWVLGDLDTSDAHCRRVAAGTGAVVISVDYRLAPENPYPAGMDDAVQVLQNVVRRAHEWNVDPGRIAVAGDSAGATMAASLALISRDYGPDLVAMCLWYPGLLIEPEPHSMMESWRSIGVPPEAVRAYRTLYLGSQSFCVPPSASAWYAPELAGLPPTLIVAAGYDPVHDDALVFAERLTKAGVRNELQVFPSLPHAFCNLAGLAPAAAAAVQETVQKLSVLLRMPSSGH